MEVQVTKHQYLFTLSLTTISHFLFLSFHFSLPFPLPLCVCLSQAPYLLLTPPSLSSSHFFCLPFPHTKPRTNKLFKHQKCFQNDEHFYVHWKVNTRVHYENLVKPYVTNHTSELPRAHPYTTLHNYCCHWRVLLHFSHHLGFISHPFPHLLLYFPSIPLLSLPLSFSLFLHLFILPSFLVSSLPFSSIVFLWDILPLTFIIIHQSWAVE